jgi:hypothetical protein
MPVKTGGIEEIRRISCVDVTVSVTSAAVGPVSMSAMPVRVGGSQGPGTHHCRLPLSCGPAVRRRLEIQHRVDSRLRVVSFDATFGVGAPVASTYLG